MNIAVIYGGRSGEHEVSLISAAAVARNIKNHNVNFQQNKVNNYMKINNNNSFYQNGINKINQNNIFFNGINSKDFNELNIHSKIFRD